MSFWELFALTSSMATILGVFLTLYALINNRTLKAEFRLTRQSLSELAELIVSEGGEDQGSS